MSANASPRLEGRRVVHAMTSLPKGPPFLGGHHLAEVFQREGAQNLWLCPPVTPLHLLAARHQRNAQGRYQLWKNGGEHIPDLGLSWAPFTPLPCLDMPGFSSAAVARMSLKLAMPSARRWCAKRGFDQPDAFILHAIHLAPLAAALRPKHVVLYLMDELSAMPGVPKGLLDLENEWIVRADSVICTDVSLAERATQLRGSEERVLFVGNGCHFDLFAAGRDQSEPNDIRGIPHPRAVFFGSGSSWVNRGLVREVASLSPDVQFLMAGPEMDERGELAGIANVHVLGPRPNTELPALCGHCEVGMVPYNRGPFHDAADRIKVYEMMAAGLPVVITKSKRYDRDHAPVIQVEENAADFARGIREALSRTDVSEERAYAQAHTWQRIADQVIDLAFPSQ